MNKRIRLVFFLHVFLVPCAFAALKLDAKIVGRNDPSPFQFIRLSVLNESNRRLEFDISLEDGRTGGTVLIQKQAIDAGTEKTYNLALPLIRASLIEVRDSLGDRSVAGLNWGKKLFLNVCAMEDWASEKELLDFSNTYNKTRASFVSQLEPGALPDNWLCYSPFRAVFITESSFLRLTPSRKDALLMWVDSGGWLTIYRSDENRMEKSMLGTIRYQSDNPILAMDIPGEWRTDKLPWQTFYNSRGALRDFPYAVKRRAGKLGGFLLATFFLIIAGPVNYVYWSKRKRIRMLLLTLPAISIAFCLLIVVYFFATQGFTKKGGTFSFTLLDESRDAGFSFSRHCLFSGLYPFGGFKFEKNTAFYPVVTSSGFTIDYTNLLHLQSGLFTPSSNFHYFTATPFKTRERLIFNPGEQTVTNGFETGIEGVMIQEGTGLFMAEGLEPGEKKKMERISADALSREFENRFLNKKERLFSSRSNFMQLFASDLLEEGKVKYMIRFKDNPPMIQTGTRIRSGRNCPVLLGIQ